MEHCLKVTPSNSCSRQSLKNSVSVNGRPFWPERRNPSSLVSRKGNTPYAIIFSKPSPKHSEGKRKRNSPPFLNGSLKKEKIKSIKLSWRKSKNINWKEMT